MASKQLRGRLRDNGMGVGSGRGVGSNRLKKVTAIITRSVHRSLVQLASTSFASAPGNLHNADPPCLRIWQAKITRQPPNTPCARTYCACVHDVA